MSLNKIKKAVIPVAGRGTRFLPATKQIPKEMIPIINKPMIHYIIEEIVAAGVEQIIFVTSSGKEAIENYFDRNLDLEKFLEGAGKPDLLELVRKVGTTIEVIAIRQKEQLGLGHAVLCAKHIIGDENFAVVLGDEIIRGNISCTKQIIDCSVKMGGKSVIGVMEIDPSTTDKYGVIDGSITSLYPKTYRINKMVEKPKPKDAPSNLATPGRYVFTPEIFKFLEKIERGVGGEYQLTDAINLMAKESEAYAHIFTGDRFDTGSIAGYLEATIKFSLDDPMYSDIMKNLLTKYSRII
jgi:UTP--glucose-1-phosphate uridylyltransferase